MLMDTAALHEFIPLASTLLLRVGEATSASVRLDVDWRPELCTAGSVLHGGALMTLADTAVALAPS
jgi:acyl-coenzyme A thioesterase PaaI-like protein